MVLKHAHNLVRGKFRQARVRVSTNAKNMGKDKIVAHDEVMVNTTFIILICLCSLDLISQPIILMIDDSVD